jgi:hypothetical protein
MRMPVRLVVAAVLLVAPLATAQTKLTLGYTGANAFVPAFVACCANRRGPGGPRRP